MNQKKYRLIYKEAFVNTLNYSLNNSINNYVSGNNNSITINAMSGIDHNENPVITMRIYIVSSKLKRIKKPFIFALKLNTGPVVKRAICKFKSGIATTISESKGGLFFECFLNESEENKLFFVFTKRIKFSIYEMY